MRLDFIGNFESPNSTENEIASALLELGHDGRFLQENHLGSWELAEKSLGETDMILWTRTGWDWRQHGTTREGAAARQTGLLTAAADAGVPTVGVHLDRWWGLQRQLEVYSEPFFKVSLLCTADGGHDEMWKAAGVNHRWMPPAVSAAECKPGIYRSDMASDVAFVGSWQPGYHHEYTLRPALIRYLQTSWGARCRLWPPSGQPAVRGASLRDLYSSVKVLIGDSCLSPKVDGSPMDRYISDRVPETLGRGGFLIHPHVDGVTDGTLYTAGEHLVTYPLGDFAALGELIGYYLKHDEERTAIAAAGRAHVIANHTYTRRLYEIVGPA